MLDPHAMPLIALLTDFGQGSPYVAQMKAVIYGILNAVQIVDITHAIHAQDIAEAAWVLADVFDAFPTDTAFVVVVDPGVGSSRALVVARGDRHWFVGPDNGVFSRIAIASPFGQIVRITETRFWRMPVSTTFHGRDIMAPVAAQLLNGVPMDQFGPPTSLEHRIIFPLAQYDSEAGEVIGRLEYSDSFGNLLTNILREDIKPLLDRGPLTIQCGHLDSIPFVQCYADATQGTCVALIGSSNRLELALVGGHAQGDLDLGRHSVVRCRPHSGNDQAT